MILLRISLMLLALSRFRMHDCALVTDSWECEPGLGILDVLHAEVEALVDVLGP